MPCISAEPAAMRAAGRNDSVRRIKKTGDDGERYMQSGEQARHTDISRNGAAAADPAEAAGEHIGRVSYEIEIGNI